MGAAGVACGASTTGACAVAGTVVPAFEIACWVGTCGWTGLVTGGVKLFGMADVGAPESKPCMSALGGAPVDIAGGANALAGAPDVNALAGRGALAVGRLLGAIDCGRPGPFPAGAGTVWDPSIPGPKVEGGGRRSTAVAQHSATCRAPLLRSSGVDRSLEKVLQEDLSELRLARFRRHPRYVTPGAWALEPLERRPHPKGLLPAVSLSPYSASRAFG